METLEDGNENLNGVEKDANERTCMRITERRSVYGCWSCIDSLHSLGYEFNMQGRLCDETTGKVAVMEDPDPDNFQRKAWIARLLSAIRNEVPAMLINKFAMKFIELPLEKRCERTQSGFLIASADLTTNQSGLVVLIEGFGTAGQWDPTLVLSEGLELGSQLSCISKCIDRGWAILTVDASCSCAPHSNRLSNEKILEGIECRKQSPNNYAEYDRTCLHFCWGDCLQKQMDIWDRYVLGLAVQKIAIIAHRCGGFLAENILKSSTKCDRLKAVCLSDWTLSTVSCEAWWHLAIPKTRHWVPSARPCGAREKTRNGVRCASAGTKDPRKIPASAVDDMLDFIREMFNRGVSSDCIPQSLPNV